MANQNIKKASLYIMVLIYFAMGIVHLVQPGRFMRFVPLWLPARLLLVYASGIAEVVLALLLLPRPTRPAAAWLTMAMLIVYLFLVHIPQAIDFYYTGNKYFILTVIRIPLQFVLIAWAWQFRKRPGLSSRLR